MNKLFGVNVYKRFDKDDLIGYDWWLNDNADQELIDKIVKDGNFEPINLTEFKKQYKKETEYSNLLDGNIPTFDDYWYEDWEQYTSNQVYGNDKFIIIVTKSTCRPIGSFKTLLENKEG